MISDSIFDIFLHLVIGHLRIMRRSDSPTNRDYIHRTLCDNLPGIETVMTLATDAEMGRARPRLVTLLGSGKIDDVQFVTLCGLLQERAVCNALHLYVDDDQCVQALGILLRWHAERMDLPAPGERQLRFWLPPGVHRWVLAGIGAVLSFFGVPFRMFQGAVEQ